MRKRSIAILGATLITTGTLVGVSSLPGVAESAVSDVPTLTVDVSKPFKDVDHAASGSLYGLGDEGWPPDEWIAPIKPKMFTQPPPGATHRPNGEPEPVGDTMWVQPVAERHGATITVRLADIFPTFPYQWLGDDYWYEQVERMVTEVTESGADNIYGYEIWNEPNWTWDPSWGSYLEMWEQTYNLIREIDPETPIIGPSDVPNMREFLTFALETDTVPDIISWHELSPGGGTPSFPATAGQSIEAHVEYYRELERELGIDPRPISINEYAAPRDAGVPGWLTRYVARLERAKVDTANLAFWHKPGRLSDLLTPVGGGSGPAHDAEPTGNYWLFKWYGEMAGHMVETTAPPSTGGGRFMEIGEPTPVTATRSPGQDGFGNAVRLNGPEPNEYVQLSAGIVSDLTDFTIATWVNPASLATWSRIFDFGAGQAVNMFLTVNAGSGPRFAITSSGAGGEQQINRTAPGQLPTDAWTHIAITKSGNTGTMWINGEVVGTNNNMTLSPSALGNTTQNWIGRSQYPDPLFDGLIDEFQIYNRSLSQTEIQSLLDSPGGTTGSDSVAWFRFDENGGDAAVDASGNGRDATVVTAAGGVETLPALEGFASADPETRTVRVIFGGTDGDIRIDVHGLNSPTVAGFGGQANVQVFTTEWTGTDGVSEGPVPLFEGQYQVRDGSISIPVAGLRETDSYVALITPSRNAPEFDGPVRRYEAESAVFGSNHQWLATTARSPLASNNRYVEPKRPGGGELRFTVDAPVAGAYDLGIRYANPTESSADGLVVVNGAESEIVSYGPTAPGGRFATHATHVILDEGANEIVLGLDSGAVSVDYIDVTPFRARFEAEAGEWSGASLSVQNMALSNFGAVFWSNNAQVRNLSQENSNLRLPVTVPAAGTYQLKIGYSTAGNEAQRRAQIPAGHILRVDEGEWQHVVYPPTQFRDMIRQTTVMVELPAGTSTITLAKNHPDHPGPTEPGTVDLDYVDVELVP